MKDRTFNIVLVLVFTTIFMLSISSMYHSKLYTDTRDAAIENDCAQYSPATGEFEWKVK